MHESAIEDFVGDTSLFLFENPVQFTDRHREVAGDWVSAIVRGRGSVSP